MKTIVDFMIPNCFWITDKLAVIELTKDLTLVFATAVFYARTNRDHQIRLIANRVACSDILFIPRGYSLYLLSASL